MTGLALKIVAGTGRGAFFALQAGTYTIGRDADNPIQIDSPMVSRRHAELRIQPDQVIICDLKSANGTVVNHRKIDESELRPGDKIFIGDSILEFSAAASQIEQRQHRETVIGNIADLSSTPSGSAPIALKMLSGVDWKFKLLIILLAALLLDHLIISQLFSQRLLQDARQTSLKRAGDITRYLAEKNKLDLAQGNETLLDVDVVMKDEGVLGAFITNESGRILVPSYKLNQQLTDETSKQALASQTNEVFRSPRLESDVYRFATPIRIYREKQADYQTLGIAMVVFSPKNLVSSREASRKIWLLALGLIPITVLILFFMIQFVTIPPINYLVEMIGKLFRGEIERIDRQTSIESLRPLIDAVNSAAIRMQQNLSSGLTSSIQPIENKDFLSENTQLRWLLTTVSDGIMVLNTSGMILALNHKARSLLEMEAPTNAGQHFEAVITNEYQKTFLRGCFDELRRAGKPNLTRVLEFGEFAYQFTLHGWNDPGGDLKYVTVVVEKL